ncbi:MAG: ABC-2 family transporter protein [Mycobacteriales bacterium]
MRTFALVRLAIWRSSLEQWTWRSFLITIVVGQAVTPLLGLFVWSAALPGSDTVATYFVVLLAVQLLTVSFEHHTLSNGIYSGTLSGALLLPQPVVIDFIGSNIGFRLWHVVFGLPFVALAAAVTSTHVTAAGLRLAVPAVLLAGTLRFVFTYTLALSALWTDRAHAVVGLGETVIFLLGGTAAPIGLLPQPLRSLGHVLPFWPMLGLPAETAAGMLRGSTLAAAYAAQIGWLAVLIALAVVIWRRGLGRFTAVGA